MHPGDTLLSVRGLRYVIHEGGQRREVLSGVELEVEAGECVALLGRSGAGKSTLLHLLAGLDVPAAGHIVIAGHNLAGLTETQRTLLRRRQLGFVHQFFNLIPTLSVLENLLLPLQMNGYTRPRAIAIAEELLAEIGLIERVHSHPDQLSGGEQQRVAIARALGHQPVLVLADEPSGNLDRDSGEQVLALLERLTRHAGGALLLVTHSRAVTRIADRVLVLEGGRIGGDEDRFAW